MRHGPTVLVSGLSLALTAGAMAGNTAALSFRSSSVLSAPEKRLTIELAYKYAAPLKRNAATIHRPQVPATDKIAIVCPNVSEPALLYADSSVGTYNPGSLKPAAANGKRIYSVMRITHRLISACRANQIRASIIVKISAAPPAVASVSFV